MKRKVLLLLMLLLLLVKSGECFGQGLPNVYSNYINGQLNKIEYDPATGNHIQYSVISGSENHFLLTDITNTTIDVKLLTNYNISDFEVFEDYVVFCGRTLSNEGLIGWFKIGDFFNQGQSVYIDHTLNIRGLNNLSDIEVYRDSDNKIHVAGIGYTSSQPNMYNKGFEAVGDFSSGMNYRVATFESDIYDLAITDNYAVFIGHRDNTNILLYSFSKNNIFSSGSHPIFMFQTDYSALQIHEPIAPENLRIVHITQDSVATLSYRLDLDPASPLVVLSQNIVLRTYDVGISHIQMTDAYKMTIPCLTGTIWGGIKEFKYDKAMLTYYALYKMDNVIDYVAQIDLSSGVPPWIFNYYDAQMGNIHTTGFCLKNSPYYTVCGYDLDNYFIYYWQGEHTSAINSCVNYEPMPFANIPIVEGKDISQSQIVTGFIPLVFSSEERESREDFNNDLYCE